MSVDDGRPTWTSRIGCDLVTVQDVADSIEFFGDRYCCARTDSTPERWPVAVTDKMFP